MNSNFYPYYSGCQKTNDCTLTGVCYDHSILEPIYKFLRGEELSKNFGEILDECLSSLCSDVQSEYESTFTEEYISEFTENNNFEFTEYGETI